MSARELLQYCQSRQGEMIEVIRQLVELESPSNNKPAADRCGEFIAERLRQLGAKLKIHPQHEAGNVLQAEFAGTRPGVMLLGHYDTVWELGTLASMPFRIQAGRLWGPGVFDMKSGIALILLALEALRVAHGESGPGGVAGQRRLAPRRHITVLLNADEETGSRESRQVIEALAKKSATVLVIEPAQGLRGAVKTARKGVGEFSIKVTGVAAHSGLDFEKGQSAVLELVHQIERIAGFTDLARGLTVNVGVVRGGTRANVVAAEASAEVDVRIAKLQDAPGIERKLRSLRPFNRKCKIVVSGGIRRPPMERNKNVVALYEKARIAGRELGWELEEAAVGGASDGNFTAALGIPTLDGLGAVGEGAHAANESVILEELPKRTALLARLIQSLSGARPT
ncbi:MAG: M20 family metallopeptidase [Terriglobales bacterium]